MKIDIKHEAIRTTLAMVVSWIFGSLAWLFSAAIIQPKYFSDPGVMLIYSAAEQVMFYWVTYLFGMIALREILESYSPKWLFVLVSTLTGGLQWLLLMTVIGGGPIQAFSYNRDRLPFYFMYAVQGFSAGLCFIYGRPQLSKPHGFYVGKEKVGKER